MNLFTTSELQTAWDEWLQYRKERKLPKYTPTGIKKTWTHLMNIANQSEQVAIEIINQSIAQNWAGLFPLKNGTTTHQPKPTRAAQQLQTGFDLIQSIANRERDKTGF